MLFLRSLILLLSFEEDESLSELEYFYSDIFELFLICLIEIVFRDEILSSSEKFIFHFEISGNDNSESHPLKILLIFLMMSIPKINQIYP